MLDANYLKMSTSIDKVPFPIFDTVGIEVQQLLLGGAAFYRVAKWDRGFLDVGAGVQYMHMKNKLDLAPSSAGIAAVSDQIAEGVVDRVASEIQSQIRGVVAGIISSSPQPPLLPSEGLVRRGQERWLWR